ncbi:two-component system, response regulator YcbB [Alkalithermobacter thermoalcaliphilus JW-YL-7 = DSM 7308]|uniref:Stage 0 sporulation protein A homolog n=2 Tax=Alkalithermobacter thermoalcaliphilus JW-YL-7 = DSM 7308 TaxID=1121328 RepID=A0ABY1IRX7_CLOPD|nr:two-component system, response regulator YcbB [[Clostridium] paradoxum JW-YL-7 = DSM 7308]
MKFYIVDDDVTIIKILENIIDDKNLGQVVGSSIDPLECIEDIILKNPDIVIVDLLMPKSDGIEVVNNIKKRKNDIKIIMISQVSSKNLIEQAYSSGIEFFISKPINIVEVVKVIENVLEKIKMEETLGRIKSMFSDLDINKSEKLKSNEIEKIRFILSKLGILGEIGSKDIINICQYLLDNKERMFNYKVSEICEKLSDNPKAMEQRIRRALNKGLTNIASLGIEDYMNDDFIQYSNSLYNFEDVRLEMDYIRGKNSYGGKVNIKKFIEGILLHSEC